MILRRYCNAGNCKTNQNKNTYSASKEFLVKKVRNIIKMPYNYYKCLRSNLENITLQRKELLPV